MEHIKKVIQWRALIAGLLVSLGASDIIGDIIAKMILASTPKNMNKMEYALSLFHNNIILAFMVIIGSLFLFLGGITAASFAKKYPIVQAAIVGILSLIYSIILKETNFAKWFEIVSIIIPIPLSILGGYIAVSIKKRHSDS